MKNKKIIYCLFLLSMLPLLSISQDSLKWLCIPGVQVGQIKANTTEQDLIEIYGKANVVRDSFLEGEGEYVNETILFPNTKNELQIIWKDAENLKSPYVITYRKPNADWKTDNNICIGTTLKELERINGKEFIILGFGWDYGGTIIDWNGGKIAKTNKLASELDLIARLSYSDKVKLNDSELEEISGDKEIKTSNKILQKMNPKIYEIIIVF